MCAGVTIRGRLAEVLAAVLAGAACAAAVGSGAAAQAAVNTCVPSTQAHPPKNRVLRVGAFNGRKGQCRTIQEAVDAAAPGNWILIGPGDYKQAASRKIEGAFGDGTAGADVLITTPGLHVRGMNRNSVMIDGTKPGTPKCSSAKADQNFGPAEGSHYLGNNGVVVYKAAGVWLQNFSTCNFLGSNAGGDSVWFDGGGASGKQEIGSWWGEYLSSTSTYWEGREIRPTSTASTRRTRTDPDISNTTTPATCPTRVTTSAPARTATRR